MLYFYIWIKHTIWQESNNMMTSLYVFKIYELWKVFGYQFYLFSKFSPDFSSDMKTTNAKFFL